MVLGSSTPSVGDWQAALEFVAAEVPSVRRCRREEKALPPEVVELQVRASLALDDADKAHLSTLAYRCRRSWARKQRAERAALGLQEPLRRSTVRKLGPDVARAT
eukprot:9868700-Lingulodinium_polyedra.AAC.1